MKTTKIFVLLISSIFLISCGDKREGGNTLLLNSLAYLSGGEGGAVVYAHRRGSSETLIIPFKKISDAQGVELDLKNGHWDFSAAVWDGGNNNNRPLEGNLTCDSIDAELTGGSVNLDLTLENCQVPKLRLAVCRNGASTLTNLHDSGLDPANCEDTGFDSYIVIIKDKGGHGKDLVSSCINTNGRSVIDSDVSLPADLRKIGIEVKAFESADCNGNDDGVTGVTYSLSPENSGDKLYEGKLILKNNSLDAVMLSPCPKDYLYIASNNISINPFCVMQYEARKDSGGDFQTYYKDVFTDDLFELWTGDNVDFNEAFDECDDLNPASPNMGEGNFSLITNTQWVAIMDNVASVRENFNNSDPLTGSLFQGYALSAYTDATSDVKKNPVPNSTQERIFKLTSGGILWDFAGNLAEWVVGSEDNGSFSPPVGSNIPNGDSSNPPWGLLDDVSFFGVNVLAPASYRNSAGWGKWHQKNSGDLYALRGGDFNNENAVDENGDSNAHGLGQLILTNPDQSPANNVGFRCVYNLP